MQLTIARNSDRSHSAVLLTLSKNSPMQNLEMWDFFVHRDKKDFEVFSEDV